ncbi:MAG: hypothetical protein Q9220_006056 [cf. Caloplaca sp. 1 TL-2023]
MAGHVDNNAARVILEAVRFSSSAEVGLFHQLVAKERLQLELVLRILLTYLPESTKPDLYRDLLLQLSSDALHEPTQILSHPVQSVKELSDHEARHQVRQLHLLFIAEEQDRQAGCTDIFTLFLLHRARRIDVESGSIPLIQELLEPFVNRDPYLRTWMVSNILPLRRLDYDYYPHIEDAYTLAAFEKLEARPGIDNLLSRSVRSGNDQAGLAARDLRGIVGPWMYGEKSRKRRKTHYDRRRSSLSRPSPTAQAASAQEKDAHNGWSDVNDWVLDLALRDFGAAADTIEHWNGPGDVDYDNLITEEEMSGKDSQGLSHRYAQAGLATIYTVTETSILALEKSYGILRKASCLSDLPEPPALEVHQESVVSDISAHYMDQLSKVHLLHNGLLRSDNALTFPKQEAISFATLVLQSCLVFQKLGHPRTSKAVVALTAFGKCHDHMEELHKTLQKIPVRTRDNSAWAEVRQQVLWLRDWRHPSSGQEMQKQEGSLGVFGKVSRVDVEVEVLKALLRASCYTVAVHVYFTQDEHPIPDDILQQTIVGAAMSFYDSADKGNRTRGGVGRASEIISAFKGYFPQSRDFHQVNALIAATHSMSFYSLTLQHAVPFRPVNIRTSKDPMSLIGKILEQNPRSYTKIDDLIGIGQNLVQAGLGPAASQDASHPTTNKAVPATTDDRDTRISTSSRSITFMAIEAALAENDFDTAYSYIINRLSPTPSPPSSTNTNSEDDDDTSWRAAYLAGRFSPPTSSSSYKTQQPSLRTLEQRLELLSLALLLAPAASLPEILTVWQQVESSLTTLLAAEAAGDDAWNTKADRYVTSPTTSTASKTLPGTLSPTTFSDFDPLQQQQPPRRSASVAAAAEREEAPMGLFDVARGAAQAFSKNIRMGSPISPVSPAKPALASSGRGAGGRGERPLSMTSSIGGSESGGEGGQGRVRKRDMLSSAVTGGLASGIGWVIGAAPAGSKSGGGV